jgi:exonuclease III
MAELSARTCYFRFLVLFASLLLSRFTAKASLCTTFQHPVNEFVARSPNPAKIDPSDVAPLLSLTAHQNGLYSVSSALWRKKKVGWTHIIILTCGDVHPCPGPDQTLPNPTRLASQLRDLKGLKITHTNIGCGGGLLAHLEEFTSVMEELSPDLMLLTETWLTDDTSDECIAVENYDVVRRDKPKNFTGAQGVAIYIRHGLPFTHRPDLEHQHLMTTAVQINLQHKKPLVVAVVYRHPRTLVAFFNHINELFYHLDSNRFHSVISGDFNINTLPPSALGTRLLETADTYGFTQVIREPTRVTETSVTCIDLTFTNMNQLYSAGVDKTCIADHFMNYIVLGKMKSSPAKHRMISARNLKRIDEQKWREDMASVPWSVIEAFENINEAWSAWKTLFFEVVDEHAPLRKFRAPRSKKKPWKCEEVDELRKLRDHYHHRACTSKRHEDWSMYRQTRNLTTKTARQRKQEHFINGIEENRGNSKGTWTVLKDLLPRKSASSGPLSLEMDGELITELKRVCDVFNDYFIGIGTKLSSCIPAVCHNALDYLNEYLNAVTIPRQPFSFTPVSSNDILRIVNRLSPSKATGLDKIQVRILKLSAQPIATSLTYLFNFSLSSGVFPDDWKIARVCPIHKKGKKSDPGNYRPVSVLPVISKIMERIAHDQMYSYLYDNELLCPQQSGFKKGHSCQTSLHRMTEYVFFRIA